MAGALAARVILLTALAVLAEIGHVGVVLAWRAILRGQSQGGLRRAVQRDARVIKFAGTAVDVFARTGNPDAIAAALGAAELTEP